MTVGTALQAEKGQFHDMHRFDVYELMRTS
jgi:hypothetical protein